MEKCDRGIGGQRDVELDLKNRNSSIFLFIISKCANFACVLLDQ